MYPSLDGTDNTKQYYYGYSRNRDTGNPDYGECSPSTYHGIEIFDIYILIVVQDTVQGPNADSMFYMNFAKHVNINKITINDSTYSIDNTHNDDANYGCVYGGTDQDIVGFDSLKEYFTNNVGKQITITLE